MAASRPVIDVGISHNFCPFGGGGVFVRCRRLQKELARQAVLIDDQARMIRLLRLRDAAETEWPEYLHANRFD